MTPDYSGGGVMMATASTISLIAYLIAFLRGSTHPRLQVNYSSEIILNKLNLMYR